METKILTDSLNHSLQMYRYPTTKKPLKGVVHLIHGASEHFARYGLFAEFLNKQGYDVVGIDFLSHGLSTDSWDYVHFGDTLGSQVAYEGITLTQQYIKEHYPNTKIYLLGHSMGSFLARKALIDQGDLYDKVILSGSAFVPPFMANFGIHLCRLIAKCKGPRTVSKLVQNMAIDANPRKMRKKRIIKGQNEEWLTKDVQVQQYYAQSKMCGQPFTVKANQDMFEWLAYVHDWSKVGQGPKEKPLFFLSGQDDALGNFGKGINKLAEKFERLGYQSVKVKLYPHNRHEVLNETNKETVWNDVLEFIEAK